MHSWIQDFSLQKDHLSLWRKATFLWEAGKPYHAQTKYLSSCDSSDVFIFLSGI